MIMFTTSFRNFLHDETGASTIWALVWFSIYVAMGGLAVDVTDAYRNKTILQSTADASALAATMSLPDQTDAVNQAIAYSATNMAYDVNGAVLDENEVFFGIWDRASRTFTENLTAPNAVRVITRRDDSNSNPLATNFLRILSLWGLPFDRFNIAVEAYAARILPDCLYKNGLIAGNEVRVESNNTFYQLCIHGDNQEDDPGKDFAVNISNNNDFDDTVAISIGDRDGDGTGMDDRPNLCKQNEINCDPDQWDYVDPWDVLPETEAIADITNTLLNGSVDALADFVPNYIGSEPGDLDFTSLADNIVEIVNGAEYTGDFIPGNIYRIRCSNKTNPISLPTGGVVLERIIIATDCNINASNALSIRDVIISSSNPGNKGQGELFETVHIASDADIGDGSFCDPTTGELSSDTTGQVSIYAMGSVSITSKSDVHGLLVWALGDIEMTAGGEVDGISAIAGHDVTATSNGSYSFCGGNFAALKEFYRTILVQ
jgi:hypothetical protein